MTNPTPAFYLRMTASMEVVFLFETVALPQKSEFWPSHPLRVEKGRAEMEGLK